MSFKDIDKLFGEEPEFPGPPFDEQVEELMKNWDVKDVFDIE